MSEVISLTGADGESFITFDARVALSAPMFRAASFELGVL